MKSFSFVCEILVTMCLLFLVPLMFFQYQQEILMQQEVQYQVVYFTDSIRNTGFLSANMYDDFLKKLANTGHSYKVQFEVYEKVWCSGQSEPIYRGTYTEEILDKIYTKGERYEMHQGDFISICVLRTDAGMIERMLSIAGARGMEGCQIPIRYGGMIRDECF